jgi:hypothetical protein
MMEFKEKGYYEALSISIPEEPNKGALKNILYIKWYVRQNGKSRYFN